MNVLLVRHGETPWNREGRYQGRTDIPLSDRRRARRSRALGERLARRADRRRDRVAAVARAGAPPRRSSAAARPRSSSIRASLEISHGEWEGKLASEVELSHAEMFGVWRIAPGRDVARRARAPRRSAMSRRARGRCSSGLCARLGADDTALDRRARRGQPRDPVPRARPAARRASGSSARRPPRSTCSSGPSLDRAPGRAAQRLGAQRRCSSSNAQHRAL